MREAPEGRFREKSPSRPGTLEAAVRSDGDVKLIPYVMAGFPTAEASVRLANQFTAAGAAAVEIGIPFSDPLADGPVVQAAGQRALEQGMTVRGALEVAAQVSGAPIVVMTYLNPVLAYRPARFAADAAAAGVSGVIIPDLPAEEAGPIAGAFHEAGLDTVFLVAPTTDDDRMGEICRHSSGFVYCVTLTGTTGARQELPATLGALLDRVRRHTTLPVAAGFGISRPEHIEALRGHADAAVVASALLAEVMADRDPMELMSTLLAACRSEG